MLKSLDCFNWQIGMPITSVPRPAGFAGRPTISWQRQFAWGRRHDHREPPEARCGQPTHNRFVGRIAAGQSSNTGLLPYRQLIEGALFHVNVAVQLYQPAALEAFPKIRIAEILRSVIVERNGASENLHAPEINLTGAMWSPGESEKLWITGFVHNLRDEPRN